MGGGLGAWTPGSEGGGAGGLKGLWPEPWGLDCALSLQGVTLTDLKEAEKVAGKALEPEKSCPQSLVRGSGAR